MKSIRDNFLEPEVRCDYQVSAFVKAVWKVELDILEKFIQICEKYNLRYCMITGSLLGAVRHKGIIPWDDDIDVAMPRPDYDRFVDVVQSELNAPHQFMNVLSHPEWNTDYAQIRNEDTTMASPFWVEKKARMNHGIMLDIYCLDGVSNKSFVRWSQNLMMRILRNVNWIAFYHGCGWRSVLKPIARVFYFLVGGANLYKIRRWVLKFAPYEKSSECGLLGFMFNEKRFQWRTQCFDSLIKSQFEYLEVNVPVGFDEILKKSYGDWHKLIKGGALHENLVVDPFHGYKEMLEDVLNENNR